MPRVSDEYRMEKKKQILDATLTVLKRKTLLAVTLQDVIDESKLSQGNIYHYFKDMDEIIANLLSSLRKEITIIPELDTIFEEENEFEVTLHQIMQLLGSFMENELTGACKLDFEFNALSMNFPERAAKIMSMVDNDSTSNLGYLMYRTMQRFQEEEATGQIHLLIPGPSLAAFISATYEGIQMTALQSLSGNPHLPWDSYRPSAQIQQLELALKCMISHKEREESHHGSSNH